MNYIEKKSVCVLAFKSNCKPTQKIKQQTHQVEASVFNLLIFISRALAIGLHVSVKKLYTLELEFQTVVICHVLGIKPGYSGRSIQCS